MGALDIHQVNARDQRMARVVEPDGQACSQQSLATRVALWACSHFL